MEVTDPYLAAVLAAKNYCLRVTDNSEEIFVLQHKSKYFFFFSVFDLFFLFFRSKILQFRQLTNMLDPIENS